MTDERPRRQALPTLNLAPGRETGREGGRREKEREMKRGKEGGGEGGGRRGGREIVRVGERETEKGGG